MHLLKRTFKLSELDDVAHAIIKIIPPSRVICFEGELGAGKTTLIKAICKQLGVIDHVSSPTFSLLNCYHTTPVSDFDQVVHIDLYRISTEEEAYRAGIEEYFYSNALCLVEWPQKASGLLPDNYMTVRLSSVHHDERFIEIISSEK
ncbi:MAG: tRNA (adenosine(37)-N6)-threonylcarbamoyltransferase complex ATPase subunit type 1 TsaE [Chitinophagia bacterium]|jgi:tRNA threonylcarbamoyladenosine biosynthesis protein TsaE|nr:tRNA (adenosine(37)-N6)-threonylcarbamoyltransferase complex ATPase subunit type 1 TsaE [Chitinophagia bacterium]